MNVYVLIIILTGLTKQPVENCGLPPCNVAITYDNACYGYA